jgi:hypothetical protein
MTDSSTLNVVSGAVAVPGYVSQSAANPARGAENAQGVDNRLYTKFDRSAAEVGTAEMSFGDFLDMINPLEHIPVVSAAYRAATGEEINPVSRITGDTIYAAALGPVSMGLSGLGALGDTMLQQATGKSADGTVVSMLFGDDKGAPATESGGAIQLADAGVAANMTATAQNPTAPVPAAAPAQPVMMAQASSPKTFLGQAALPQAALQAAAATSASNPASAAASTITSPPQAAAPVQTAANTLALADAGQAKFIPLDRSKAAYAGGTGADATVMQSAMQNRSLALALAQSGHAMQFNNPMRANRLAVAQPPGAAANAASGADANGSTGNAQTNTATAAAAPAPAMATTQTLDGHALPQALIDDLVALKALNQYKSTASGPAVTGGSVNLTN